MRSIRSNKRQIGRRKTKNKYKLIFLLLLFVLCVFSFFIFKIVDYNSSSKVSYNNQLQFNKDTIYLDENINPQFYRLIFSLDNTYKINEIYLFFRESAYKLDSNLYVQYDNNYYQINNIINVIKQKRGDSANKNFIFFLDNILGIKISDYLYTSSNEFSNGSKYFSNDVNDNWQTYINRISNKNFFDLNLYTLNLVQGNNMKVYDESSNDSIIRKSNTNLNAKIELYNATSIQGYGGDIQRLLINMGLNIVRVDNYSSTLANTKIIIQQKDDTVTNYLINILGTNNTSSSLPPDINSIADYVILLGGDTLQLF